METPVTPPLHETAKISLKPSTLLAPVPVVLISCQGTPGGGKEKPNLLTIAWAGTINSEPPMVSISVRKSRYSYDQICQSREFVINLVDQQLLRATDFCGVRSGADVDKFTECQLTAVPAEHMTYAPAVAESPLTMSCSVTQIIPLESHDVFIARIDAVQVRRDLLDASNRLRLDRANLVAYAHGNYFSLGEQLGFFGYSVARPEVLKKRMKASVDRSPGRTKSPSRKRPDRPLNTNQQTRTSQPTQPMQDSRQTKYQKKNRPGT